MVAERGAGMRRYCNPWIPAGAIEVLDEEQGAILDVGGGAAPYHKAAHVIDILPFDADRLALNAWGGAQGGETTDHRPQTTGNFEGTTKTLRHEGEEGTTEHAENTEKKNDEHRWHSGEYTEMDLCAGERWPFTDKAFDLGLSSHCLEDLRDPVQVVREMARCCRRVLIICPSRLFEQTRGVDHPNYAGMMHHPWLVYENEGVLCFRRKTQLVEFPGHHLVCPFGWKLKTESGCLFYYAGQPLAKEVVYFEASEDAAELRAYVEAHKDLSGVLEGDGSFRNWRKVVWYLRQKYRHAL